MNFTNLFQKITSDGHVPIAIFIFITGSAIHVLHGLDASFVAFATSTYAFLGGHAYVTSRSPDDPDGK